jgi:hypothetical protein
MPAGRRATRLARPVLVSAIALAALCAGAVPVSASPDVPPLPDGVGPRDAGSVVVTDPQQRPLSEGASATLFSLDLPDGAACPGDTANDDWRVQGFMIPVDDDPATIRYGVIGPEGEQFPLFAFDTRPFAHQFTEVAAAPGEPGVIPALPALTFGVFTPGDVPPGTYRIGVACTFFRQTADYWDTEIVIELDPSDELAGFRWSVPNAPDGAIDATDTGGGVSGWLLLAAGLGGAAALLALAGVVAGRRRAGTTDSTHHSNHPQPLTAEDLA